jgi:tetratricopeptide (TPR) repeat protein
MPLPGFQDLLDPLPLVVKDLPDQASQDVAAAYDRATLFDSQPALDMLAAAERAVLVPPDFEADWNEWFRAFTSDSSDPAPIPDAVLNALRDDPRNGDRLSNLAVALYFTALTEWQGGAAGQIRATYGSGVADVLRLLGATVQAFPNSRGPALNYAFLSRFYYRFGPADTAQVLDPQAVLSGWSSAHPDDVTALQLLVSGHLRRFEPVAGSTMAQLNRLAEGPDAPRAALGHALLGDLQLSLARSQSSNSPFTAQQTARQALREYDQALALSDDSSIYSARAMALEITGDISAAIETQLRAVELAPESAPLRILLGEFYRQQQGDESQVRTAMRQARTTSREALAIAARQQDPLLRDVQLRIDPELYQGNRRDVEYTSFRPQRTYFHIGPVGSVPGGAAAFIISYDLIPKYEHEPRVASVSRPAERAAYDAIIASVILGDPRDITDDVDKLRPIIGDTPEFNGPSGTLTNLQADIIPAAQLVADLGDLANADFSAGLGTAADWLRYAGLPAQAATLCRTALDRPDARTQRSVLLKCVGENAYLAGDYAVARQAFADLGDDLYTGFVAQVAGDSREAIRRYQTVLALPDKDLYREVRGYAAARLGDVYLDSGDASSAIKAYDQAIQIFASPSPDSSLRPERQVLQHVRNNRGVARLKGQTRSGSAPNCLGRAATACANALADFEAAARSDPSNPVYLLGKAWVERLQGNTQAATQTLNEALQVDPTMFPALNDLGVLAVQAGDISGARRAFRDALAVNPEYDLALWNLGMVEMQRGVRGVPRGQAYLARAILRNPSFSASGLAYRTDEGVYRVEFNERLRPGAGWSFASATSVATTAFGLVTVLMVILRTIAYLGTDKVQNTVSEWAEAATKRVERGIGRRFSLPAGDGWRRWLPLLITLPALAFVTSWSALREDPGSAAASVSLALFAALTAVIAHEIGHALVALKLKVQLRPAQWGPGVLLALVLLPINLNAGPFPGQRVLSEDNESAWWVHLGGPLANLLVALSAYTLFFFQPLPGLRLIALVQLVAMSYALLPFEPLDGAALARSRPKVVGGFASFVLIAGVLFSVGIL